MTQYTLPELPYAYNALEPFCSAEILELHHSAHHAAYVQGANSTLEKLAEARAEESSDTLNGLLRDLAFHVSGHILHSLFWENMTPDESQPSADLAAAMETSFGSMNNLREQFFAAAKSIQGSGWAAISFEPTSKKLIVHQIRDHHANSVIAARPMLVLDMWEHAYYLQYQNRKNDWIEAFWSLIDWRTVSERQSQIIAGDI